jgi:ribonuclease HI
VRALLDVTTGPLQVYIDSKVVVKGIHRGANWRHTRNAYQWEEFWKALGDRSLEATKIKAHTSESAVVRAGGTALAWKANALADELAEEAAREAQLDPDLIAEVRRLDAETAEIQSHLLAIRLEVAKHAPQLYGPSSSYQRKQEARARARAKRAATEEAARVSRHRLCSRTNKCLDCFLGPGRA